ncbi:hypothetical protein HY991_00030 [Candidatus Micrarchaeota archaeon]|nr:hypothetical protein [Candidatus Micrarchaeota archaeon]
MKKIAKSITEVIKQLGRVKPAEEGIYLDERPLLPEEHSQLMMHLRTLEKFIKRKKEHLSPLGMRSIYRKTEGRRPK